MQAILLAAMTLAPCQPTGGHDPPAILKLTVEQRKEARDAIVLAAGPDANALMKRYGDDGIFGLANLSAGVGKEVVALFTKGRFDNLSDPHAMLQIFRFHGDPAAIWVLANFDRLLTDPNTFEAFVERPMEYVYDLRNLDEDSERIRAWRKYPRDSKGDAPADETLGPLLMVAAGGLLGAGFIWKMRQRGGF